MKRNIHQNYIHLGLRARAEPQPPFTGLDWYADYGARNAADGREGRLVAMHAFSKPWDTWEMHPHGDEVVLCVSGEITLIQETPEGGVATLTLRAGEYAINGPGIWHTADVANEATVVFITAGEGTQLRPR